MSMLGTVLTRLQQRVTSLIYNAQALTQQLLSNFTGALTAMQTRFAASLTLYLNQFVATAQKLKALAAQCITQVQSIKAVLTTAKATLIQLGQQLVTTVRRTPQLVMQLLKRKP